MPQSLVDCLFTLTMPDGSTKKFQGEENFKKHLAGEEPEQLVDRDVESGASIGDQLLTHLGIKKDAPPTVLTAENIDGYKPEGLNEVQTKVVNDVKNIVKAIGALVKKSTKKDLSVNLHTDPASYTKAVIKAGGTEQSSQSKGFWMGTDGAIHLNMSKVTTDTGNHEAFHAVLDYLEANHPEVIDRFHSQLGKLKGGQDIIDQANESYAGEDPVQIKREAITDFVARVADGSFKIDKTNFQKVKDYFTDLFKKMGINIPIKDIANIKDLKQIAQRVSDSFNKGKDILATKDGGATGKAQFSKEKIEKMRQNDVEKRVVPGRKVSTRTPSAKGGPEDVHTTDKYIVDLKSARESEPNYINNALEISGYSLLSGISKGEREVLQKGLLAKSKGGTPEDVKKAMKVADKVYNKFVRAVADNLLHLHDSFDPALRDISKRWYDGANVIAQDYGKKYGVSTDQASGVIAALSPQMDWYKNVSLAQRVMDIVKNKSDFIFDQKMSDKYVELSGNLMKFKGESKEDMAKRKIVAMDRAREEVKSLMGKRLDADPEMFAKTLRAYDETYNDKSYDILSPNGDSMGKAKNKDGSLSSIGWQGYGTINKAISMIKDGSPENISKQLGEMHKVRNFYNNISHPNSEMGDVTIDTHAVAAGLFKPLAGSDSEVIANLSGKSSAHTGSTGTYAAFADAYRLAAKERGLLPRQMQSITWEAVRGLFKDTWKTEENKKKISDIWNQNNKKTVTDEQTRERIKDAAGGIDQPTWARPDSEAAPEKQDGGKSKKLPAGSDMGNDGAAGRGDSGKPKTKVVRPTTGVDKPQFSKSPIEFGKEVEEKHGGKVDLTGDLEGKKDLTLSRIELPKDKRGAGIGTEMMKDITDYADANGKRIVLTPSTDFGGSSVTRLKEFYKKLGFVENKGANKDFSTKESMYRLPQINGKPQFSIGPDQVKDLPYESKFPETREFTEAVKNTEGAKMTEDGLVINAVRWQSPDQEGQESLRTGVFYLPANDPNTKYYKGGKLGYGGTEKVEGEILVKRPIFVKGATGGKAPEAAYDEIKGKGAYKKMREDVLAQVYHYGRRTRGDDIAGVLTDYGADENIAWEMADRATKGNNLAYAVQENIVAHAVREAGYDAVLGFSKKKDGSNFISEIFDVREITYPSQGEPGDIHEDYKNPQFSKTKDFAQIRDFIQMQRDRGISDDDIRDALEDKADDAGIDRKHIDKLMEKPTMTPEERQKINDTDARLDEALDAQEQKSLWEKIKDSNPISAVKNLVKWGVTKVNPSSFDETGGMSRETMSLIRKEGGAVNRKNEQMDVDSHKLMDMWNKIPRKEKLKFILGVENASKYGGPESQELRDLAALYRQRMDDVFDVISKIKDIPFIEDYFPHFWEKPDKAKSYFASVYSKTPFEGNKSFLKARFYEDILQGMEKKDKGGGGLKLATDNPEEMVRLAEMNAWKFEQAHKVFKGMQKNGMMKFYREGGQPEGWQLVDDPLFKRMSMYVTEDGDPAKSTGGYYMPEPVSKVVNNYLSRGLGGKPVYRAIREWNNVKNLFQLGFGFFHLTTTTMDATVTGVANAMNRISSGHFLGGAADFLKSITVVPNIAQTLMRGDKAIKEYRGDGMSADVEAMIQANARTGLTKMYTLDSWYNLKKSVGKLRADKDYSQIPKVIKNALLSLPEAAAKPLMGWYVPRLKVGGFLRTMDVELQRMGPMSEAEIQKLRQKTWDSMDDRLGQMVYDNIFWDKTMKDLSFLSIRSFGWTGGTIRALGKGVLEAPGSAVSLVKGKGMSQNTAWLLSLPMTVGMYGAMYQYMMTGKGPDNWKDYFFPKDGTKNADGTDHRVSLPSYMKDAFSYAKHPWKTIKDKTSPFINEVVSLLENKDFYGTEIYGSDSDNYFKKGLDVLGDILKYEGESFIPFSFKAQSSEDQSPRQQIEQKFGIMGAKKEFQNDPIQLAISEASERSFKDETKSKEDAVRIKARRDVRNALFAGKKWTDIPQQVKDDAKLFGSSLRRYLADAHLDPYKRMFRDLPSERQVEVWAKMKPDEKKSYKQYLNSVSSFHNIIRSKPELLKKPEFAQAYKEIISH